MLKAILEKLVRVESKVDRMEKACSSKLERMDDRLGHLKRFKFHQSVTW